MKMFKLLSFVALFSAVTSVHALEFTVRDGLLVTTENTDGGNVYYPRSLNAREINVAYQSNPYLATVKRKISYALSHENTDEVKVIFQSSDTGQQIGSYDNFDHIVKIVEFLPYKNTFVVTGLNGVKKLKIDFEYDKKEGIHKVTAQADDKLPLYSLFQVEDMEDIDICGLIEEVLIMARGADDEQRAPGNQRVDRNHSTPNGRTGTR